MNLSRRSTLRAALVIALMLIITLASSRLRADTGTCGLGMTTLPFTDVSSSNIFFCSIASAYFTGLTNGTSGTTYSPSANVSREQMAAFVSRTMDQSLKRGSRRAALDQYWTPNSSGNRRLTAVGGGPRSVKSDGADLWVANYGHHTVSRVRASDGKLLETWNLNNFSTIGESYPVGILVAEGMIFVTGANGGRLYQIDPTQPLTGAVTLPISLGGLSDGISFDGARIWTANNEGSISIVTLNPLAVSTVTTGFTSPTGILYDGANMWVTDFDAGELFKLDSNGAIIQTVSVGTNPRYPVFDGANIWVPNQGSNSVTVVRASTGAVLATLTGNGLDVPRTAAFDGERILVTNIIGDSVSLWKAADLTPLASVSTGVSTHPFGACSDGLNFWITLNSNGKLARF